MGHGVFKGAFGRRSWENGGVDVVTQVTLIVPIFRVILVRSDETLVEMARRVRFRLRQRVWWAFKLLVVEG
jgi:hypothetical protein